MLVCIFVLFVCIIVRKFPYTLYMYVHVNNFVVLVKVGMHFLCYWSVKPSREMSQTLTCLMFNGIK